MREHPLYKDIELKLISSIILSNNEPLVSEIDESEFKIPQIAKFVKSYYIEKKKLPSVGVVKELCGLDLIQNLSLDTEDYLKLLRERNLRSECIKRSKTAKILFSDRKFENAKSEVEKILSKILESNHNKEKDVLDIREEAIERWQKYLDVQTGKEDVYGTPTPWTQLDEWTYGVGQGDFWIIVAKSNVGKTWLSLLFADKAWNSGKKILYISFEMRVAKIIQRWDAIHAKVSAHGLKIGKLSNFPEDANQEKAYLESLENMVNLPETIVVGNSRVSTPYDIEILANAYKPDMIVIDAFNKIRIPGRDMYQGIRDSHDYLFDFGKRENITIIATCQLQRKGDKLDDIGYAWGIVENSDVGLVMTRTQNLIESREAGLSLEKVRDGERNKAFRIGFDLDIMEFPFIEEDDFENRRW